MRSTFWFSFTLLCLLVGCSRDVSDSESPVRGASDITPEEEGYLEVDGGKIWYRTVGGRDKGTPLLLLHGGPGGGSRTLESLESLGQDRLVVFYDQLGAGRSDHPDDTSLWTIERHIRELDFVRQSLGLDEVHLLGHSWGSMLLIEYLLTEPKGVVSATFASPLFSTKRWIDDAKQRVRELPVEVQRVIEIHEKAGTTDSAEYQEAVDLFYHRFLSRTDPWPETMNLTFQEFGTDVYSYMWGPSEFSATGTLSTWDRMEALPGLNLPTLFMVGEFDETFPSTVQDYAQRVPGSRFEVIPDAAHITFVDAPDECVDLMRGFLGDVEAHP